MKRVEIMKNKKNKNNFKDIQPLVSVVIPVFNGQAYLEETIFSVQKSDYKNFEVILVNDGSSDNSKKLCETLQKKYKKIRFFSFPKNKGLSHVLNFAIKHAKGKYIARLNQDDIMLKNRLSKQVVFLEKNKDYVAIGGNIILFDNQTIIDKTIFPETDSEIKKRWLYFSPFADPAVMYKKSTFLKTSGYKQQFWPVDDVSMWYQLGKYGKLANLPDVATYVRWHKDAGSIKSHRIQTQKLFKLHLWAAKHIERPTIPIWTFWVTQYIAGALLPARFNWLVFRALRKLLS